MSGFVVESIVFCDYLTQDANGKGVLVGTYFGELRLSSAPAKLPNMFVQVVLHPLLQEFKFAIEFIDPTGRPLFRLAGNNRISMIPVPQMRTVVGLQIPQVDFPGVGKYTLNVRDMNGKLMCSRELEINVGPALEFSAEINAEINVSQGASRSPSS